MTVQTVNVSLDDYLEQNEGLRCAVLEVLEATGHLLFRKLHCEVVDEVVFLRGEVTSFHLKQVAQAAVLGLGLVKGVRNLLIVRPQQARPFGEEEVMAGMGP